MLSLQTTTTTTVLRPFFRDHPCEPVPEENLDFMVQGKINRGRHTDHPAGRRSIRTNQCQPPPSPHFFTGLMPFLPPNQQRQSTEGNCYRPLIQVIMADRMPMTLSDRRLFRCNFLFSCTIVNKDFTWASRGRSVLCDSWASCNDNYSSKIWWGLCCICQCMPMSLTTERLFQHA